MQPINHIKGWLTKDRLRNTRSAPWWGLSDIDRPSTSPKQSGCCAVRIRIGVTGRALAYRAGSWVIAVWRCALCAPPVMLIRILNTRSRTTCLNRRHAWLIEITLPDFVLDFWRSLSFPFVFLSSPPFRCEVGRVTWPRGQHEH